MKIKTVEILVEGCGTDKLILGTDLPEGCYPFKGNASLVMHVAKGEGEKYAKDNFPDAFIWKTNLR